PPETTRQNPTVTLPSPLLCLDERRHWLGNAHDAESAPALVIDFDDSALQQHAIFRHVKALRRIVQEAFHDRLNLTAENAFMWSREPGVAEKRGSAGEDLLIRRLHMRVRS